MLHKDGRMVAAFSNCIDGQIMGFISTEEDTFEISPLTERLRNISQSVHLARSGIQDGMLVNDFYVVKRATFPNFTDDDTEEIDYWYDEDAPIIEVDFPIEDHEATSEGGDANPMIETAVFLDHVGYRRLSQV